VHVFLSDLHMTDADVGGSVSDGQLAAFVRRLREIAAERKIRIKLVFVGDILELLRSRSWTKLWNEQQSAPWSGMCKGFENFAGGFAEECAIAVASDIRRRYTQLADSLREAVGDGAIETHYIYGNHDYMVQLSPELRRSIVDLLSLQHDPKRPFDYTYTDASASVYAAHGHCHDEVNWHREADGYWALGDAVVLRVVNRFPAEACKALGVRPDTKLGRALHDIDSVEPISDIPLYVRWLGEAMLTGKTQKDKLGDAWKRVIDDFLAIEEFREPAGYGSGPHQQLRSGFALSTRLKWAELLARLAELFPSQGVDYRAKATGLRSGSEGRYRVVLFGHTHDPMFVPLDKTGDEASFYVNTGCWRRVVIRPGSKAPGPFIAQRVASYFTVDPQVTAEPAERYHLYQEWHAI
jgi:UDP-2,3-diacylglucosamine pyrophosphatase LpxH